MCGVLFCFVFFIVKKVGIGWLDVMFLLVVMGVIVVVIGFELVGVVVNMVGLLLVDGQLLDSKIIIILMVILVVMVFGFVLFCGFLVIILILIGVLVGYVLLFVMGVVDIILIVEVYWFVLLIFYILCFEWFVIFIILFVVLVVIVEYVGYLVVIVNIVKCDLICDLGLYCLMFVNGLLMIVFGFFGLMFNIIYGENIGVMVIIWVYSIWVIGGVVIIVILFFCVGKLVVVIQIILVLVMGGVFLLLYGVIGVLGICVLIELKVDYSKVQNLIFIFVILIIGVSGVKVYIGVVELKGMVLVIIVGIVFSLIFKFISVLCLEEVVFDVVDSEEFK